MRERIDAIFAALVLRTMSELLRLSIRIDGAASVAAPPAGPGAVGTLLSVRRWIIGAMSAATA